MEKAVLKSLRSFAGTIEEIAEDNYLSTVDVRDMLHRLEKLEKVKKQGHPASNNYRDQIYFEVKNSRAGHFPQIQKQRSD